MTPSPFPETTTGGTGTGSSGSKNSYCSQYADKALKHIHQRIELTGSVPDNDPEWSNDWDHHYNYCLQMPESLSKYREEQRKSWLDSHSASNSGMSKDSFCRQYAEKALQQIRQRKERTGSAPADPVWKEDFNRHFNWCLGVSESSAERGTMQRQQWLDSHSAVKPKNPKEAFCREYTENALRQIRIRKAMGSKVPAVMPAPNDPVWKEDYNHHYNWCLGAPESSAKRGSKTRQDWIDQHRR